MARGKSGRIVVEVPPDFKAELYRALGEEGLTLREWFVCEATNFVEMYRQQTLFSRDRRNPDKAE